MTRRAQSTGPGQLTDAEWAAAASVLRDAFAGAVGDGETSPELATRARAKARRITARRRAAAATVAAAVVVVASVAVVVTSAPRPHVAVGVGVAALVPRWPARGNLAHDHAAVDAAMRAWDTAGAGRHTLRSVLYAGDDGTGATILLLATDRDGELRLGGFRREDAASGSAAPASFQLLRDTAVTTPLSGVALREQGPGGSDVVFLLTDPAFTSVTWQEPGGGADSQMPWSDSLFGGIDLISFDAGEAPSAVTISAPDGRHADVRVVG